MKKNTLYFILVLSLVVLIISVAATCTFCGANPAQSSSTLAGEETTVSAEATSSTASAASTTSAQGGGESTTTQSGGGTTTTSSSGKSAPTISLNIYEGPTYSAADSVYYYRIEAIVTGKPAPTVSFSRDDSNGAWGTKKVQINLHAGESYTLTATATNSEGTASASINLVYGSSGDTSTSSSSTTSTSASIVNLDVPKVNTEGGYIEEGGKINSGGGLFAGDSAAGSGYIGDRRVRGYISFDITALSGKAIDQATLTFNINSIYGTPDPAFGGMWVGVVDWGAEALVLSDFGLPQVGIQLFDMAGSGNITCDTATLKTQLQNAINDGKSRFQIRISHPGLASNLNNTWDGWSYLQAGVNLNINYH